VFSPLITSTFCSEASSPRTMRVYYLFPHPFLSLVARNLFASRPFPSLTRFPFSSTCDEQDAPLSKTPPFPFPSSDGGHPLSFLIFSTPGPLQRFTVFEAYEGQFSGFSTNSVFSCFYVFLLYGLPSPPSQGYPRAPCPFSRRRFRFSL